MKTKLKYAFCIFITLLLTATVVFMPYFYYSLRSDDSGLRQTEEFTIPNLTSNSSYEEIYKLLYSDSAIWIEGNIADWEKITSDLRKSIYEVSGFFLDNSYTAEMAKVINSMTELGGLEAMIVSGTVDSNPVSISLVYAEFFNDSFGMYVLADRYTHKIYQLTIESSETLFDLESLSMNSAEDNDFIKSTEVYVKDAVSKYFNSQVHAQTKVIINPDSFGFSIFAEDYYSLRYDSYNSDEVIEQ